MVDAHMAQVEEIEASLRTRSNEAFNEADTDGDGFLSPVELQTFLLRVEQELGAEFAKEVRDAADRHRGISAEEFYRVTFKMEKDNVAAELGVLC
jgi:Ca2+-binding EF-hand superfamily protein